MATPSVKPSTGDRVADNLPFVIVFLLLVDSFHFVFARLLIPYLPPMTSAFFVLLVATVETTVFLGLRRQIQPGVLRQNLRFFAVIGSTVAISTVLNYASVQFVDPGTGSLLARASTLFALGFGIIWLKERLSRREVVGAGIAVFGIFIISFQPGEFLRLGSLMVLTASFLYSFHAAYVKRYGGELNFANFFLFRVASTCFFLFLFAFTLQELVMPQGEVWLLLLLVGTVDVVISRVLYYLALRHLQMSMHAIVLTLSPVLAVLWSFVLFGVIPTTQGIVGGLAVIAGVVLVTLSRRSRKAVASGR